MRKIDAGDRAAVTQFLNEAVSQIWAGHIKVTRDTFEAIAYTFFYRGIFVEVVHRMGNNWVQVENENIDDLGAPPGMLFRLREAVTAPECRRRAMSRRTKREIKAIEASWDAYHKRGRTGAEKLIRRAMAA